MAVQERLDHVLFETGWLDQTHMVKQEVRSDTRSEVDEPHYGDAACFGQSITGFLYA